MTLDDEMDLGDIRPGSEIGKIKTQSSMGAFGRIRGSWCSLSRGKKIAVSVGVGAIVLFSLGVLVARAFFGAPSDKSVDSANPQPGEKPTTMPPISIPALDEPKDHVNPLNGNPMTKATYEESQKYQPMIVMVENHVDSRPQSGFLSADIVYETLAEGGITRFLTLYWENAPEKVGPVRSMRKYFLDIASEYPEAPIMHIGQASSNNPETDAWGYIAKYASKSLPVIASGLFWREPRPGLAIEHTAYSSVPQLREKVQAAGWGIGPPDLVAWKFKDDAPKKERPGSQSVQINWGAWSVPAYQVQWKYDLETNSYNRSYVSGSDAMDAKGKQAKAKTIIVQFTSQTVALNEPDGKPRLINKLVGTGKALVIQDGGAIEGTWSKPERTARTVFYDALGKEIMLVHGPIWIEIVPTGSKILY